MATLAVGVDISQHQLTWDELQRRVGFAEDAGFESAWVFDHFKALYGDRRGPCFEAWTLLAALAVTTERIRLGALVTGVTYRHPSVLAAEAVTVDHLSNGRLNLGIGAAWFAEEHHELGIDFPPASVRARQLDEGITVLRALMSEDPAAFEGRHYHLRNAAYYPRPVQQPHPPIWVGAGGEKLTIPIAARQADVWHGFGSTATLVRRSQQIDRVAAESGRDPAAVARSSNLSLSEPWDEVRARAEELRAAGFSYLIASWPSEGWPRIEEFAADVLPGLTG